jgi:hypothetical protein
MVKAPQYIVGGDERHVLRELCCDAWIQLRGRVKGDDSLDRNAPPRNREEEAAKAKARAARDSALEGAKFPAVLAQMPPRGRTLGARKVDALISRTGARVLRLQ